MFSWKPIRLQRRLGGTGQELLCRCESLNPLSWVKEPYILGPSERLMEPAGGRVHRMGDHVSENDFPGHYITERGHRTLGYKIKDRLW